MSDLKLEIDIDDLSNKFENVKKKVEADLIKGVDDLTKMTHAHILDEAKDKLGSVSDVYRDNLPLPERIDIGGETIWIIKLNKEALWIEEGVKSGFMEGLLNGKSAKTSKDGKKYAVIPFKHNEKPSGQSSNARDVANEIKQSMKEQGISWGKIEYGQDGSPRTGKIHSFDVNTAKNKKDGSGTPYGQNVSIYQTKIKNKQGKEEVRRDVMTFRVITEDHREQGKWTHPGREKADLLGEAVKWAENYWTTDLLPKILQKYE